jgi:hypothetical protein
LINSATGILRANGGTLQLTGASGGTFDNSGTIESVNGGVLQFNAAVTSSGIVDVGSGTFTATGNYTQTAGTFVLAGGSVQSNNALNFQAGLVNARGTINASVSNNATLRPALGGTGLNVNGNVSLLASSNLNFQLGGITQGSHYGFLNVNGTVGLGGNLVVTFVNGFQNSVMQSDSFTVLASTNSFTGSFANVASGTRLITSDSSGSFLVTYSGNNVVLSDFTGVALKTVNTLAANTSKPTTVGSDVVSTPAPDAGSAEVGSTANPASPRPALPADDKRLRRAARFPRTGAKPPTETQSANGTATYVSDTNQILQMLDDSAPSNGSTTDPTGISKKHHPSRNRERNSQRDRKPGLNHGRADRQHLPPP